eukprot:359441-Chlamydomonas_euryale.AAC.4
MHDCRVLSLSNFVSSSPATSSCTPTRRATSLTASLPIHSHASLTGTLVPSGTNMKLMESSKNAADTCCGQLKRQVSAELRLLVLNQATAPDVLSYEGAQVVAGFMQRFREI